MKTPWKSVAICGPTASGKSALSLELARALNGEVVNVDSVQVYRGLDIGSAKLSMAERSDVPHHVLDVFSPGETVNVAEFRRTALEAISDISSRDKVPVLVGGSGMYFTTLLHGLAEVPATPRDIRKAVACMSAHEMYAELQRVDPETAARLHERDQQRVSRALEIYRITGKKPSELLGEHTFARQDVVSLVIVLCRPRDELYERINRRARAMIDAGLIEETKSIVESFGRVAPLATLGYKQALDYVDGKIGFDSLGDEIALHTRRFAKRQMTYWRNEPRKRGWLVRPLENEPAVEVLGVQGFSARAQKTMKPFRAFPFSSDELITCVRARLAEELSRTEVWYVQLSE